MDLREKKTMRSIYNAFLEIRSKKDIEKVTVKELCDKAEISKATFYLHYRDIYDLSETLQKDVVKEILSHVNDPGDMIYDPTKSSKEMIEGFYASRSMVSILFSGSQFSRLPEMLEQEIKDILFGKYPELKEDVYANVRLTYQLMGSFYAFYKYENEFGYKAIFDSVQHITEFFNL